jgi:hypothetical protein
MKSILSASVLLASLFVVGCAATATTEETDQARNTNNDLSYRPGSRIAVRNATPLTQEEKDKQAEEARKTLSGASGPAVSR